MTEINNNTSKPTKPIRFPILILLLANTVIALVYLFLTRGFSYDLIKNGEPLFALPTAIILWVTFGMILVLGLAPYFMFNLSNFKTDRYGLKLNYTLFYLHFLGVILWTLFTFTLSLPIVGVIFLGITICALIFTVYRFMTNSIVSGVMLTLWALWLIYLFILNLAYILL